MMAAIKRVIWENILDSARREREEIEVAMNAGPPWWVGDELLQEWWWRTNQIDEAETMLGLKGYHVGVRVG